MEYTINIKGRLMDLSTPQVMGILNVTPDSFYSGSRKQTEILRQQSFCQRPYRSQQHLQKRLLLLRYQKKQYKLRPLPP